MQRPSLSSNFPSASREAASAETAGIPASAPGPQEEPLLHTVIGSLAPQRSTDELRRKELVPVSYHATGVPRSVPLEEQTMVRTPAGPLPAELVTFYPSGALKRLFPLNGRLSGYWTQEDEASLARPITLDTPLGRWKVKVISVCFHENGELRNVALWPGEILELPTPAGLVQAHMGVDFWPDGGLRSLEPARPRAVSTPVGEVMAYDPDAVGLSGDAGSLRFNEAGTVSAVSTVQTCISLQLDGEATRICPVWRESLCGMTEKEPVPLRLEFTAQTLACSQEQPGEPLLLPLELCRAEPRGLDINPLPSLACSV